MRHYHFWNEGFRCSRDVPYGEGFDIGAPQVGVRSLSSLNLRSSSDSRPRLLRFLLDCEPSPPFPAARKPAPNNIMSGLSCRRNAKQITSGPNNDALCLF